MGVLRRAVVIGMALAVVLLAWAGPAGAYVPPRSGPIVDNALVVSDGDEATLARGADRLRAATGVELAVLTVAGTFDATREAKEAVAAWQLGGPGGKGVLVFVATVDRVTRVEITEALRPSLSPEAAQAILDDGVLSRFKKGDMGGGLALLVAKVGERLGAPDLGLDDLAGRQGRKDLLAGAGVVGAIGACGVASWLLGRGRRRGADGSYERDHREWSSTSSGGSSSSTSSSSDSSGASGSW